MFTDNKDLFDLFINEPTTQEERCSAAHEYVNSKDGLISKETATDLGLWILYGAKDVTVRTQIQLAQYKAETEGSNAERVN